jgi:Fe-S-cluster containining protein
MYRLLYSEQARNHTPQPKHPLTPWQRLADNTDAYFRRILAAHRSQMQCGAGCSMCCHHQLSVPVVEALVLLQALENLPAAIKSTLHQLPSTPDTEKGCALLMDDRCVAYVGRPLACRTHGLLVRQPDLDRATDPTGPSAPAAIYRCPLNFVDGTYPEEALVDVDRMTAELMAVNQVVAHQFGASAELRVSIRELARRGVKALPDLPLQHASV